MFHRSCPGQTQCFYFFLKLHVCVGHTPALHMPGCCVTTCYMQFYSNWLVTLFLITAKPFKQDHQKGSSSPTLPAHPFLPCPLLFPPSVRFEYIMFCYLYLPFPLTAFLCCASLPITHLPLTLSWQTSVFLKTG